MLLFCYNSYHDYVFWCCEIRIWMYFLLKQDCMHFVLLCYENAQKLVCDQYESQSHFYNLISPIFHLHSHNMRLFSVLDEFEVFLKLFINIKMTYFCMPDWFLYSVLYLLKCSWYQAISISFQTNLNIFSPLIQLLQSLSNYIDCRAGDRHSGVISIGGPFYRRSLRLSGVFCTWIPFVFFPPVSRYLAVWPIIFQHIRTDKKSSQWECVTLSCGRLPARDLFDAALFLYSLWLQPAVELHCTYSANKIENG